MPAPVADVTRLFRTLGDPTRLRLLRLMADHELSVMELAEVTQLAQSRVSNHLKVLREEGLIQERRDGAWRHYRLDRDRLPGAARELWGAVEPSLVDEAPFAADAKRLMRVLAQRHNGRKGHFFEVNAGEWDNIRAELFGDSIAREMLRAFLPPGLVVADVGSGTGYMIELLAHRPERLIAIDTSEAMLAVARRKVADLHLDNVEFRHGDAHEPPLAPGEVDLLLLVMLLHHLAEPARALANAARALKPGGRLLVVDFVEHQETWLRDLMDNRRLGFAKNDLETILRSAGLVLDFWSVLPGRPWITPDNTRVNVPDAFAALARRQEDVR